MAHREIESEMLQHPANASHVRMLCVQANKRGALRSGVRWMRRFSPVDEERNNTVSREYCGVCELP